jgi:hypothetical protein
MVTPRPNEETRVEVMHELIRAHRYPSKAEHGRAAPWAALVGRAQS